MHTVRVRFANGVLKPLEALDLDEGQEVTVSINDGTSHKRRGRGMRAAAGAWKGPPRATATEARNLRSTPHDLLASARPVGSVRYLVDSDWVIDYFHGVEQAVRHLLLES